MTTLIAPGTAGQRGPACAAHLRPATLGMRFLLAFAAIAALAIGSWSVAARAVERAEPGGSLVSVTKSSFDPRRHALTEFADLEPE